MTKGSVYGGVLYLPQHPAADIHGLVRAVMCETVEQIAVRQREERRG